MWVSEKWDARFMELAKHVAGWSKDPSTQVGAVVVDERKLVVGMGFNGFPRGVNDFQHRLDDRPTKYKFVVHAEPNALLVAGERARGSAIYVWPFFPCGECAKLIIQAGVKHVHYSKAESHVARWSDSQNIAMEMFDEANVGVRGFE